MINFIKKNYYYAVFFISLFLLYSFVIYPLLYADPTATYAFSYAIVNGEIPYLDFNIISTPFYAYVMSLGLLIWNNFSMILLENSLLVTIMFYLLNKMYQKKSYILLFVCSLVGFFCINPTYNYMTIFMLVLILFFEKEHHDKDYWIGVLVGFAILTKHTVGAFFILPSILYYWKDKKKMGKRLLGVFSVGILFLFYLWITNSFVSFFDLCVLGLFDFSSNNSHPTSIYFYLTILLLIISIIITIKHKEEISNYYLLFTFPLTIPLFDLHHFAYYFFCFSIQLLPLIRRYEYELGKLSFRLFIVCTILFGIVVRNLQPPILNKDINHYQYVYNGVDNYKVNVKLFRFFDEYEGALIISYFKMFYDISRDKRIDYFDVPLYGNAGYSGSNKMIAKIKKMHDRYIIVDRIHYEEENEYSQFDKNIVRYVIENCEKVEERYGFAVYYKK